MARLQVLPRDLQPGDKIDRVNPDLHVVQATVREVKKVRSYGRYTNYKVYLVEYDALPDNRKSWAENGHLQPFILDPRRRVFIERGER